MGLTAAPEAEPGSNSVKNEVAAGESALLDRLAGADHSARGQTLLGRCQRATAEVCCRGERQGHVRLKGEVGTAGTGAHPRGARGRPLPLAI